MVFIGFYYPNHEVEWRPIYWYDGEKTKYSISNIGLVRNDKNGKILKTNFYKGYERLNLTHKGEQKQYFVHRLVATAFIPNPKNKPEVNHKDGKKYHNYDKNLEWVTSSENSKHAIETGLAKSIYSTKKSKRIPEAKIRMVCEMLQSGIDVTFVEMGKVTGVDRRIISDIYKRRIYTNISKDYKVENYTIKTDFSKKGDMSENTKYDDRMVHHVCQLIDSGKYSLPEIAEKTKVPYQTVRNIYYGSCRKSISSQYKFAQSRENPLYEDKKKEVIKACELLDKGYNTKEVSEMVNLSRSAIRNIYSGNSWKEVSKDYNFSKIKDKRFKENRINKSN